VNALLDLLTPPLFSSADSYENYMKKARNAFFRKENRLLATSFRMVPVLPKEEPFFQDLQKNLWFGKPSIITYLRILAKSILGRYENIFLKPN
jgi:hypothetical protein